MNPGRISEPRGNGKNHRLGSPGLHIAGGCETVSRHIQVHDDDIRFQPPCQPNGFDRICGFAQDLDFALLFKCSLLQSAHLGNIIGKQNFD